MSQKRLLGGGFGKLLSTQGLGGRLFMGAFIGSLFVDVPQAAAAMTNENDPDVVDALAAYEAAYLYQLKNGHPSQDLAVRALVAFDKVMVKAGLGNNELYRALYAEYYKTASGIAFP